MKFNPTHIVLMLVLVFGVVFVAMADGRGSGAGGGDGATALEQFHKKNAYLKAQKSGK